jgi:ABC-type dipeptide/oligopeptide/nickel transport system ATPase subunit
VIFLDIRGVGEKYGGSGLDILKYVATHNPLIYVAVFSAKPFTGSEAEVIRQHARRSITKDCTVYEIIEILEGYCASMTENAVIRMLEDRVRLGWIAKWKIRRGRQLSRGQIERISRASAMGADAAKIVANMTTIAVALIKIFHGAGP